jgi:hypothetical protein
MMLIRMNFSFRSRLCFLQCPKAEFYSESKQARVVISRLSDYTLLTSMILPDRAVWVIGNYPFRKGCSFLLMGRLK